MEAKVVFKTCRITCPDSSLMDYVETIQGGAGRVIKERLRPELLRIKREKNYSDHDMAFALIALGYALLKQTDSINGAATKLCGLAYFAKEWMKSKLPV